MRRLVGFFVFGAIAYAVATGPKSPAPSPGGEPARSFERSAPTRVARLEPAAYTPQTPTVAPLATLSLRDASPSASPVITAPTAEPILPPTADIAPRLMVQRDKVMLRKAPAAKAAKLGTLARGEIVLERARSGTWREIELADGRRGWVNATAFEERPAKHAKREQPNAEPPAPRKIEPPSTGAVVATAAIAALIVQESRASYGGTCGCPEDRDRAGRRCGRRSAYSKAGGRSLFCYAEDVPAALIERRTARR